MQTSKSYLKTLFYPILFVVMLSNCGGNKDKYGYMIKTLDSLNITLIKEQGVFEKLDTVKIKSVLDSINTHRSLLNTRLKDTIRPKEALMITEFYNAGDGLNHVLKMKTQVYQDIEDSKNQLKTLTSDLKEGKLKEEKAIEFYSTEKEATIRMIKSLKYLTELSEEKLMHYERSKPIIDSLSQKLKTTK